MAERATQSISAYQVGADGLATGPVVNHSAGAVPFGFAFGKRGQVFFSEAGGGQRAERGLVVPGGGRRHVGGGECIGADLPGRGVLVVETNDGRFAYTGNAASNSITGFAIDQGGSLSLLDADGHTASTGDGATDLALSLNSQFLYVRNTRAGTLSAYAVGGDGALTGIGGAGCPAWAGRAWRRTNPRRFA